MSYTDKELLRASQLAYFEINKAALDDVTDYFREISKTTVGSDIS